MVGLVKRWDDNSLHGALDADPPKLERKASSRRKNTDYPDETEIITKLQREINTLKDKLQTHQVCNQKLTVRCQF